MPIERTPTYAAFSAVLADWEDEAVFKLEDEVRTLLEQPGWHELNTLMQRGREQVQQNLEVAPFTEGSQYARYMGFLAGTRVLPEVAASVLEHADARREQIAKLERHQQAREESVA